MKILVVEDEQRIAKSLKKGLEQERYSVSLAFQGDEGLDVALQEEFDLIILDLMLPKRDGISICRELRQHGNNTPILMLTARAQISDKVSGLDVGADDYLTKPFSFDELFARVRALSRRPPSVKAQKLQVADLQLDQKTYEVSRDHHQLHLSQKEFMLLSYLMSNSNKILSKEKIISQVWDYDSDVLPNTVEANIKNLRKKIDQPFPTLPTLIHTVRGFGYKVGLDSDASEATK